MALKIHSSPADAAYERFRQLVRNRKLFTHKDPKLTEADTRAKLIDPLFRDVLGWHETEIRREKAVESGFADYVLGAGFAHVLVEAKRTKPRFRLADPTKSRRIKLDGPHLLGQKLVRPFLEQAQRYAGDLGAASALLTNGDQFIVFRPYLNGMSWTSGHAIVWHDHQDIANHFADFYNLLSRDRVNAGSLLEGFEQIEGATTQVYAPIDYLSNPDHELVRNPLWPKISKVMAPILEDRPDDPILLEDIIRNCYVTTPLSDQADKNLDALLSDAMPKVLRDAGVVDVQPLLLGNNAFELAIEEDIRKTRPGTYILTGGVGSGKTTFLLRFSRVVNRSFIAKHCVWIHVNFLPIGNVDPAEQDATIARYIIRAARRLLETEYENYVPSTGTDVRLLFEEHIEKAKLTTLHGIAPESTEWNDKVNALVDRLFNDDEEFVNAVLKRARRRGLRTVVVLDNTDQLGEAFQERVFLLSQKLAQMYAALCIVALREERFFAAYRRGIFDAFGDRRFHIGSPQLRVVIRRRLEYGRRTFGELTRSGELQATEAEVEKAGLLLRAVIRSITVHNENIVRMLACVSNGDMRHALGMFREFVSSGNTNIDKIVRIERDGGYSVPFHEFAKSAILGSRRFYRGSVSHIVNVFVRSEAKAASHLTGARILARLVSAQGVASPHGEGFLSTETVLREYRESFGNAEDLVFTGSELLRRGLLESEPPRMKSISETDGLRVTAAGAYYFRFLMRSFAYIDLIFVDTSIADKQLAKTLASMANTSEMQVRFDRVRLFLSYLEACDAEETLVSMRRSGPYRDAVTKEVRKQIDSEMKFIAKKLRMDGVG